MADDWSAFTATPAGAPAAASASTQATSASDGWEAFTAPAAPAADSPASAPVPPAPPPASSGVMGIASRFVLPTQDETSGLVAGKDRALRDVIDRPARWLAQTTDALGITHGQGDQVAAGNTADRQAYDAYAAQNPTADTGRLSGQALLTLPVGGAIGRVAGAVGDAVGTAAGKVAPILETGIDRGASFLSGTAGGAGGVVPRAVQGASVITNGALQGGTAAGITAGQSDAPLLDQMKTGAELGAIAAPAIRGAVASAGAAKQSLSGGQINPEVAKLAQLARDKYGINLTLDQVSPSPFVQNLGAALRQVPGSGMAPAQAALQSQFTKAVGNTIGENVDQITPAVMQRAAQRIGGVMDDVAAQTPVIPAADLTAGLAQVQHDASFLTDGQRQVIGKHIENVLDAIGPNGAITGQQYQSLTKFNSPLGKALRSSDSDVRNAAIDIRSHLDDALGQSLPEGSQVAQQLKNARLQYKNLKTIEPLVVKGEPGEISPAALQGQVNRSFKGRGMREAQPDLAELADIGHQFNLRSDSGTAGRSMISAGLGAAGGLATSLVTDPMNALYGAGAMGGSIAAGRIAGNVLRNPARINSLIQSGVAPGPALPSLANQLLPYVAPAAVVATPEPVKNWLNRQ